MNEALRAELMQMDEHDQAVRAELAADGSLFDGYHPRMSAVHDANAARLRAIIATHGWPTGRLVGRTGGIAPTYNQRSDGKAEPCLTSAGVAGTRRLISGEAAEFLCQSEVPQSMKHDLLRLTPGPR
jgi:hypothetical protein